MPKFAANLTMMFNEWDFLDRFAAAADAGFTAVEFLFPYDHPPEAIADRLRRAGLKPALFNLPPGDWANGDRGTASIPTRREENRAALAKAIPYIEATGVPAVHLMAGLSAPDDAGNLASYLDAVKDTAARLAPLGVTLVLEPINARDIPGYFLNSVDRGAAIVQELAIENVRLQFDIYHCQIIHGDVTKRLQAMMPVTGHVQIASVPSRNEPDDEELNYPFLFKILDKLGYRGYVGCEYRPRGRTLDGLGWFRQRG